MRGHVNNSDWVWCRMETKITCISIKTHSSVYWNREKIRKPTKIKHKYARRQLNEKKRSKKHVKDTYPDNVCSRKMKFICQIHIRNIFTWFWRWLVVIFHCIFEESFSVRYRFRYFSWSRRWLFSVCFFSSSTHS